MTFRRWLVGASLAARLAVASSLFGLIIAGGAIFLGYWTLSDQLDKRTAAELDGKVLLLAHLLSEMPAPPAISEQLHRFNDLLVGHEDLHLAIVDMGTNRVIWSSSAVAQRAVEHLRIQGTEDASTEWSATPAQRYSTAVGVRPVASGQPVRFYLSIDRRADSALLRAFVGATLLGVPFLLVLVSAGVWLIVRTGLLPMTRFGRLAASVNTSSLAQRLSLDGLPAELSALAREFNAMLERMDEGVRRLKEFSGDLAHEMRTPVATLMGRSQVALSHQRTNEELREVLAGNIDELQRLSRLISDMLFIARADQADIAMEREPVSLHEAALHVVDYLSLLAEERNVTVGVYGQAEVRGDRMLLQRAVTNLLSNAIRHASPASEVRVEISRRDDFALLAVVNQGSGIAPEHLERIFERFYRIDSARARHDGGTGLGLAIVRTIMSAHHGRVDARSTCGETTVTLHIPVDLHGAACVVQPTPKRPLA
ncbi:heavy metal sensor histidine kinase [Variovorax sp. RA8]|uniref:heavy metal sensor histidine kinase n=1 Tax=Variovorax sp. (strain JCM 16519 / RA8) TaxID=662548 RepID=UPI001316EF0B|nr:heavy metal sensor histidine kinase [Variovorax sp. RA8]VTU44462.1 Sensor protein CzcS precursor [Variovorax sp. RA8]